MIGVILILADWSLKVLKETKEAMWSRYNLNSLLSILSSKVVLTSLTILLFSIHAIRGQWTLIECWNSRGEYGYCVDYHNQTGCVHGTPDADYSGNCYPSGVKLMCRES